MADLYWFGRSFLALLNAEINFTSDSIKVMLLTSSYTPDRTLHDYVDDVRAYEVSGAGYTAGGVALASKTITYVAANSATAWAASTAYAVGDVVRPTVATGHCYRCIVAGTSGATEPTWPTVNGQNVTDGTVTWDEIGAGYVVIDAADTIWNPVTVTARYAVIYDDTPATDATKPLLAYTDFGADKVVDDTELKIKWSANGILRIPAA